MSKLVLYVLTISNICHVFLLICESSQWIINFDIISIQSGLLPRLLAMNNWSWILTTAQAFDGKQNAASFYFEFSANESFRVGVVMLSKQLSAPPQITSARQASSDPEAKTSRPRLQKRIRSLPPQREAPKFWLWVTMVFSRLFFTSVQIKEYINCLIVVFCCCFDYTSITFFRCFSFAQ